MIKLKIHSLDLATFENASIATNQFSKIRLDCPFSDRYSKKFCFLNLSKYDHPFHLVPEDKDENRAEIISKLRPFGWVFDENESTSSFRENLCKT